MRPHIFYVINSFILFIRRIQVNNSRIFNNMLDAMRLVVQSQLYAFYTQHIILYYILWALLRGTQTINVSMFTSRKKKH